MLALKVLQCIENKVAFLIKTKDKDFLIEATDLHIHLDHVITFENNECLFIEGQPELSMKQFKLCNDQNLLKIYLDKLKCSLASRQDHNELELQYILILTKYTTSYKIQINMQFNIENNYKVNLLNLKTESELNKIRKMTVAPFFPVFEDLTSNKILSIEVLDFVYWERQLEYLKNWNFEKFQAIKIIQFSVCHSSTLIDKEIVEKLKRKLPNVRIQIMTINHETDHLGQSYFMLFIDTDNI